MAEVAILRKWGGEFVFVSDDGERFYEVTAEPVTDADLDGLRPLGGPRDGMLPLSFARRWILAAGETRFYRVD